MNRTQLQEQLLQETKYSRWYLNIIENAQSENRKKVNKSHKDYAYYENHHILPKSIFKEYSNIQENLWNSVLLTAKEHFICHVCIWKHYRSLAFIYGERKMSSALKLMSGSGKYKSKHYINFKLNLTVSEETKTKISKANKGRVPPNLGIPKTEYQRTKLIEALNRVDPETFKTPIDVREERRMKTIYDSKFNRSEEFGFKSAETRKIYQHSINEKISRTKLNDPNIKERAKIGIDTQKLTMCNNGKTIFENRIEKYKKTMSDKSIEEVKSSIRKMKQTKKEQFKVRIFNDNGDFKEEIHYQDAKKIYPMLLFKTNGPLYENSSPTSNREIEQEWKFKI